MNKILESKRMKLNILFLEDSIRDYELISEYLLNTNQDITFNHVDNLDAFSDALKSESYDLILSDFKLPGFDAFDAIKVSRECCPQVPFICVSGTIGEDTAIELIKNGAVDYVLKDKLQRLPYVIERALAETAEKKAREEAENDLQKTFSNLQLVLKSAPISVFATDADGIFTLHQGRALGRVKMEQGENVGESAYILFNDLDIELRYGTIIKGQELIGRVLEGETIIGITRFKEGVFENHFAPLKDKDGVIAGLVGVAIDITENVEAQNALREIHDQYTLLFNNSLDAILITSPNGAIISVNAAASKMFGWTEEELCNLKRDDVVDLNHPQLSIALEERAQTGHYQGELKLVRKDKSTFSAEISSNVYLDKYGNERTSMLIRDITERKKIEDIIKESEVHYRTLANSGQALVWTSNTQKQCDYFNQPWLDFTGRTLEQELGDGWMENIHPDDLDYCWAIFSNAADKREKFTMEYRLHHQSGVYRWIKDSGSPRYDSKGEYLGYIGHCLDITQNKEASNELLELKNSLEIKVLEKTKELNERIAELERFHDATIDRELRMKELRDEIERLKGNV